MIMNPDYEYAVSVSYLAMLIEDDNTLMVSVWDDCKVGREMFMKLDEGQDPRRAVLDLDIDQVKAQLFSDDFESIDPCDTFCSYLEKIDYAAEAGLISDSQSQDCRNILAEARCDMSELAGRPAPLSRLVDTTLRDLAATAKVHPGYFGVKRKKNPRLDQFIQDIWMPLMAAINQELMEEYASEPAM